MIDTGRSLCSVQGTMPGSPTRCPHAVGEHFCGATAGSCQFQLGPPRAPGSSGVSPDADPPPGAPPEQ